MTSDRPDVSVAVDAATALMAPICLTQDVALALDAVREMARLAEQRAFEEGQNSMMRSLREARRERDEAREQVRSLTVERDALRARLEDYSSFSKQAVDRADLAEIDRDALRARLSRAREALDSAEGVCGICARKLAALRAALSEPPAGS